jgi:hypothetical protein
MAAFRQRSTEVGVAARRVQVRVDALLDELHRAPPFSSELSVATIVHPRVGLAIPGRVAVMEVAFGRLTVSVASATLLDVLKEADHPAAWFF